MGDASRTATITVSQLNAYLKGLIETDPIISDVCLIAEILQIRFYETGNTWYLTLTDRESIIPAVIYSFVQVDPVPKVGQTVWCKGKLKWWNKKGNATFQIVAISIAGQGELSAQFHAIKTKLAAEGLFLDSRKRPLPRFPDRIAIITALDSAALTDFIRISHDQNRGFELFIVGATVQGDTCPQSVCHAIHYCTGLDPDIIVILRGGGSAADLSGFNNETLVRTIANSPIPIATAIGHESDTTLSDFAADMRFSTPSAAASGLCDPLHTWASQLPARLNRLSLRILDDIAIIRSDVMAILNRMKSEIFRQYTTCNTQLGSGIHRLKLANPLLKLTQGYTIVRRMDDHTIIRSVTELSAGTHVQLTVSDGSRGAIVAECDRA